MRWEEELLEKEAEMEDKRKREERQHEFRMMQMLGPMFQQNNYREYPGQPPNSGPFDYEY